MRNDAVDIVGELNKIQPTTQQVDYSGFMQNFQPVLNNPNYFVPQQGLLQNTPVLDTLSDLDVMQQRPQVVMDMLNQYPTLESDFQQSFAVSPDTFNMNVYKPLPYDPSFWESFINRGGTLDGSLDLGGLGAAGLVGASAYKLLSGDDSASITDTTTGLTSSVVDTGTPSSDVTTNEIVTVEDVSDSDDTNTVTTDDGKVTVIDTSLDDTTTDGSNLSTKGVVEVVDLQTDNTLDATTADSGTTEVTDTTLSDVKTNANNLIIDSLFSTGDISGAELDSLTNTINASTSVIDINNVLSDAFGTAGKQIPVSSVLTKGGTPLISTSSYNVINPATISGLNFKGNIATDVATGADAFSNILGLDEPIAGYNAIFNNRGFSPDFKVVDVTENGVKVGEKIVQKNFLDKQFDKLGNFLNNPINEGFGSAGSAINEATQLTGAEALSLAGGILSGLDAIEDGNVSNVFNTAAGLSGSGLLGSQAQALATNPATAAIGTLLFVANQMAPDPSAKTGSGTYDYDTNTASEFGMGGDKFKQEHVDAASSISQGIGTAVNTIANSYGLSVEGDHLVEFGRDRPLSITFGDTDEEQTNTDRLNYSPETGDIINSTDDIKRFYFLNDGNTSTRVTDNVVKGTNLLALKAIANNEDSINLKDFVLPARSSDDVMRGYMSLGYDEVAANALTGASQNPSPETASLLGSLLQPNTVDTNLFLTDAERTSLLDKGYTNEQLDTLLYGTTQDSVAAINLLNINEENNQTNI